MTRDRIAPDPLVVCDDASVTFGRDAASVTAVDAVTCAIGPGDRVAITGRSGSGKSTLLHLLAGLESATSGTVRWPGIGKRSELRPGGVGVVFQSPSLIPSLDVVENTELPLLLMGRSRDVARIAALDALSSLALSDVTHRLPEELSGGQSQRVAVARVLSQRPALILADEPTGQLDHSTARRVVAELIDAARATGAALVLSTHDIEIAALLDAQWSMADGRLHTATGAPCSR